MKHLWSLLTILFAIGSVAHAQAACNIESEHDFLHSNISVKERSMLTFYYSSLCQPGLVDLKDISLPDNASPQAQALYYFGLHNLSRYEGIAVPNGPDMLALGIESKIEWISAEAKLITAIKLIDSDLLIEGESLLHEIVPVAADIGYKRLLARTYRWLGNVNVQQSDVKASLKYYKMAFELITEIGDNFQTTMTLNNIATVYMMAGQWHKAHNYLKRALDLYKINHYDNSLFEAILYANSSTTYFALGEHSKATTYMEMALTDADQTGSSRIKLSTLADISMQYAKVGQTTEALDMAQRCVDVSQESGNTDHMLANCYEAFATAFLAEKNYSQAIHYAQKVLDILSDSESDEVVWEMDILGKLVQAYEAQGDYQQALNYMKRESLVRQIFYRETYSEEILSEKSALERQLNSREVELLEAQNELQDITLKEQRAREILYLTLFGILAYFSLRGILRLRKANAVLKSQNTTDSLTGAFNRRFLDEWLEQQSALKSKTQYLVSIIDIDHFKNFNDQFGHEVGDSVLRETVRVLQAKLRKDDLLVRWGGEEFILIMPLESTNMVNDTLERLRTTIEQHEFLYQQHTFKVTISLGASISDAENIQSDWESIFAKADSALYRAKNGGRNQYSIDPEYTSVG
ncbi:MULTISPECIES: diguanylate cyclase [unclassified Vibrio]|uniref:tetratricopeptide repeat-containing diguanylate cyclase n=1 Tax=unclassified Vibrio TaxID=2614977 RepID=UPI001110A0F7|nr:diguanylate cyclase [Vibrio sp. Hep-1b-8]TMX45936.1 virulence protein [Vibrio sp. Hep-1b-8]